MDREKNVSFAVGSLHQPAHRLLAFKKSITPVSSLEEKKEDPIEVKSIESNQSLASNERENYRSRDSSGDSNMTLKMTPVSVDCTCSCNFLRSRKKNN